CSGRGPDRGRRRGVYHPTPGSPRRLRAVAGSCARWHR
ncbi:MAG: hypothetical protein AVDCRST_MAG76-710, partial [uncultured Acidimicrobiales bacterium]